MIETRAVVNSPPTKAVTMRTATLIIEFESTEDLPVPVDDFKGMFIDSIENKLIVTYVDSVTYRRLLVLQLAKILADSTFKVLRRYVQGSSRGRFYVNGDDTFNHSIEQQIQWGIKNPERRDHELRTIEELIRLDDSREED